MKVALITGITGQDGSYLAELLLKKGYDVHGIVRRSSSINTGRIDHILGKITLHHGDMLDTTSLRRVVCDVEPREVYNLAAQSHVRVSFDEPELTQAVTGDAAMRLMDICVDLLGKDYARFYQAGSSEMFGNAKPPQGKTTPFAPVSPYGVAKLSAHWYGVNLRKSGKLDVRNGILFNHESPRRGETFVTQKIARAIARGETPLLWNLDARRDWGWAPDYVHAMWRFMQRQRGSDEIVATGHSYSVRQFLKAAGGRLYGLREQYKRPNEIDHLRGAPTVRVPDRGLKFIASKMVEAARCAR